MTKKTDPFYDDTLNIVCPITNKDVLDDCHITIEFGYGSDLDMTTYTFSPVHEDVGKEVLNYIDKMIAKKYKEHPTLGVELSNNPSVEDFGKDVLEDSFDKLPKANDLTKAEWGFEE